MARSISSSFLRRMKKEQETIFIVEDGENDDVLVPTGILNEGRRDIYT